MTEKQQIEFLRMADEFRALKKIFEATSRSYPKNLHFIVVCHGLADVCEMLGQGTKRPKK